MDSLSRSQVDKMLIDRVSKYTSGPYGPNCSEEEIGIISSKQEKFHAVSSFAGLPLWQRNQRKQYCMVATLLYMGVCESVQWATFNF